MEGEDLESAHRQLGRLLLRISAARAKRHASAVADAVVNGIRTALDGAAS
jgi:hypothetical protein